MKPLTTRQHVAISEILVQPNLTAAAKCAGVPLRTLRGWLTNAPFVAELRRQRDECLLPVRNTLRGHLLSAVETLAELLHPPTSESVRLGAANSILRTGADWANADVALRLSEIETRIKLPEHAFFGTISEEKQ